MKGKNYSTEDKISSPVVRGKMASLRDECLNREQLWTLTEARVVIEDYRCQYNHYRPHSKLDYQSPKRFAATTQSAPSPAPVSPGLLTPKVDTPRQTT